MKLVILSIWILLMPNRAPAKEPPPPLTYHPYTNAGFTVNGLWWYEENKKKLTRLPARARGTVPAEVWRLGRNTSCMRIRFKSDTRSLWFKVKKNNRDMINMSRIGHSGIDIYVGPPGKMEHWVVAKPNWNRKEFKVEALSNLEQEEREYTLYLPTYTSVTGLEIGLTPGASISPPSPFSTSKPVVFYGTSITQGGVASRPASGYVARVGRKLNIDLINLGFSGSGKGEPELAKLVSEVDASAFVLDYVANVRPGELRKTLKPFIRTIRKKHPETPILLLGRIFFSGDRFSKWILDGRVKCAEIMDAQCRELRAGGDRNIHYLDGLELVGPDDDCVTADGVHPSDNGFRLMAENLAPVLMKLLK